MFFIILNLALLFGIFVLALYLYKLFIFLFAPFIFGYVVSKMLKPLVNFYRDKFKFGHEFSCGLALFTFIVILVYFISWIVGSISNQVTQLTLSTDDIMYNFTYFSRTVTRWYNDKATVLPEVLSEPMKNFTSTLSSTFIDLVSNLLKNIPEKTFNFGKKFFSITFLGTISSFFFMKYDKDVHTVIFKYTPDIVKKSLVRIKISSLTVLAGYFSTQLKIMSIIFIMASIALGFSGVSYFLLFALAIAIIDVLPLFGSGFVLWPMAFYYFVTGDYVTCVVLIVTYVCILITRQFLEPRLLGDTLEVNPIITLMSMYVGLQVIGFAGLLIGPLVIIIIKQLLEHKDNDNN